MRRYVTVQSVPGKTTARVSLVDGALSAKVTVSTYIGGVTAAVRAADRRALQALEEVRLASEEAS